MSSTRQQVDGDMRKEAAAHAYKDTHKLSLTHSLNLSLKQSFTHSLTNLQMQIKDGRKGGREDCGKKEGMEEGKIERQAEKIQKHQHSTGHEFRVGCQRGPPLPSQRHESGALVPSPYSAFISRANPIEAFSSSTAPSASNTSSSLALLSPLKSELCGRAGSVREDKNAFVSKVERIVLSPGTTRCANRVEKKRSERAIEEMWMQLGGTPSPCRPSLCRS